MRTVQSHFFFVFFIFLMSNLILVADQQPSLPSKEKILGSYVEDFRNDPAASEPSTFRIRIKDETEDQWHIGINGEKEGAGKYKVGLQKEFSCNFSIIYTVELLRLNEIYSNKMNALMTMRQADANDSTLMDVEFIPGFQPEAFFFAMFIPFTFHFWTHSFPEIVAFGKQHNREVYGENTVVFYFQKGFRSAWGQIGKNQHINEDPKDQSNSSPTMSIGISGKAMAKIGGQEVNLRTGQMIFIPSGVTHEAWNPYDEPNKIILLMFRDEAQSSPQQGL